MWTAGQGRQPMSRLCRSSFPRARHRFARRATQAGAYAGPASACLVRGVRQILDDEIGQRKICVVGWGERAEQNSYLVDRGFFRRLQPGRADQPCDPLALRQWSWRGHRGISDRRRLGALVIWVCCFVRLGGNVSRCRSARPSSIALRPRRPECQRRSGKRDPRAKVLAQIDGQRTVRVLPAGNGVHFAFGPGGQLDPRRSDHGGQGGSQWAFYGRGGRSATPGADGSPTVEGAPLGGADGAAQGRVGHPWRQRRKAMHAGADGAPLDRVGGPRPRGCLKGR